MGGYTASIKTEQTPAGQSRGLFPLVRDGVCLDHVCITTRGRVSPENMKHVPFLVPRLEPLHSPAILATTVPPGPHEGLVPAVFSPVPAVGRLEILRQSSLPGFSPFHPSGLPT